MRRVTDMLGREVDLEKAQRQQVEKAGLVLKLSIDDAPPPAASSEDDDDDGRLCHVCKHQCFLSFVMCPCTVGKWVCLRHSKEVCGCPENRHILFYRNETRYLDSLCTKMQTICQRC